MPSSVKRFDCNVAEHQPWSLISPGRELGKKKFSCPTDNWETARPARVQPNEFLLKYSLDSYELTVFPDGRVIVKGTQDPAVARGLYARYIGD